MRPIALALALLLAFGYPAALLAAAFSPAIPGSSYPVPANAVPGSSSERAQAWASLTAQQQQQYIATFWNTIVPESALLAAESTGAAEPVGEPEGKEPDAEVLLDGAVVRRARAPVSRQPPELGEAGPTLAPAASAAAAAPGASVREAPNGNLQLAPKIDNVDIVASPTSGTAPLTVAFSVSWSQPIASRSWSFGDGGTSTAASPSHVYAAAGSYTVSLTVVHATNGLQYSDTRVITVSAPPPAGPDLDQDGFADQFETDLAYSFRPTYHVSGGELAGTGFADFGNYVPQTPTQVYPSTPARNHVRIKPLFKTWYGGQHLGFIQIDYFSMWNRDDGLVVSSSCIALTGGVAWFIDQVVRTGHTLDNERSVALVAAPTVGGAYNTSVSAYKLYDFFTAAHEDTINDKSRYVDFNPQPAGSSLHLGLSRRKHATYPFNPDWYPLAPWWLIIDTYDWLQFLYFVGEIDWWEYLIYLYIADVVFFVCWVEHFTDQGGARPTASKNLGDVGHAINGCGFIETTASRNKLNKVLWSIP